MLIECHDGQEYYVILQCSEQLNNLSNIKIKYLSYINMDDNIYIALNYP